MCIRDSSNLEHTGCSSIYADRNLYSGQSIGFAGCRCRTDRTLSLIHIWFRDCDEIQSVLMAWQGGMEGGLATADILCGDVNPSGKLSDTCLLYTSRCV